MSVQAWYYNETEEDPRQLHQFKPNQQVDSNILDSIGVLQWHFDPDTELDKVDSLAKERYYVSRDIV
jgi:hypothetical protein